MASNITEQGSSPSAPDQRVMHMNPRIEKDRQMIADARQRGSGALFKTFLKLSGPGWLQAGITLGGASLATSLYLGVLVGVRFMWLQPLAMILGIIMLSAIAYVTLSTGQRPLRAINSHVNPVLGWSWLIAAMMANLVWSMPQFALGTAAIQQNLLPSLVGGGPDSLIQNPLTAKVVVGCSFLAICIAVTTFYDTGGWGVKVFEFIIKAVVTMIVVCFIGVVIKLSMEGKIDWGEILSGLVPDLRLFVRPTDKIMLHIQKVAERFQPFWTNMIVGQQRDVMISAAAAAVGINMTFLLPYSMLRKGWDKDFRGLAIFDLSMGLFIPFILATGCVAIASASQFHSIPAPGFLGEVDEQGKPIEPAKNLVLPYKNLVTQRLKFEIGENAFEQLIESERQQRIEALPEADKKMAAMLVKRDSFNLADTLAPLTGSVIAQYIFGFGVIGMAMSTAIILMTINGLCFSELVNRPPRGWSQRLGSLMVSIGALGPFFWKDAAPYLAVPTSVFAMVLLPIAYFAFFLLMNQKSFLGEHAPSGGKRILWNILMALAAGAAAFGCIWSLWSNLHWRGIGLLIGFIVICVVVHFARKNKAAA